MALTTSYICPVKIIEKICASEPRNLRIKDVKNGSRKTQGYTEKRGERRDSVPPLRTDSYRNVGQTRSRSVSRTRSYRPKADIPKPPPAPARAPVTPTRGPTAASKPVSI